LTGGVDASHAPEIMLLSKSRSRSQASNSFWLGGLPPTRAPWKPFVTSIPTSVTRPSEATCTTASRRWFAYPAGRKRLSRARGDGYVAHSASMNLASSVSAIVAPPFMPITSHHLNVGPAVLLLGRPHRFQ